jgi:ubiquinone biosynthesis protein Coq4
MNTTTTQRIHDGLSSWTMIRELPLTKKARFARASLRFALDPDRTEQLFEILELFSEPRSGPGHEAIRGFLDALLADPDVRACCKEPYLPPAANLQRLRRLPDGTLGHEFAAFMEQQGLSVVFYPVIPVTDELSWLEMRFRQQHDLLHVVLGFPTSIPGELGVQAFQVAQTNTPVASALIGAGLLHCAFLKPWLLHACLSEVTRGFTLGKSMRPVLGYRFEDMWDRSLEEVRAELAQLPTEMPLGW